ncbi:glycosyltransferase [Gilvimarinus chinensis]|uniref:glycosyltransferase n=1 Tax=Gilvimarinus chinensis TaxID=396005 RepID=UPI000379BFAD|nr:glycosyltransferase [Gilvimarinus chinensis]
MDVKTNIPTAAAQALDFILRSELPTVLVVTHGWGGGVQQHIQCLADISHVNFIVLKGMGGGSVSIELKPAESKSAVIDAGGFGKNTLEGWRLWLSAVPVQRVHLHHLHGWPVEVLELLQVLGRPLDITVHDAYLTSRYYHKDVTGPSCSDVGWPEVDVARQELLRPIVEMAERVVLPSAFLKADITQAFPAANVCVVPHPEQVPALAKIFKVVVLGALSKEKGLEVVERVAELALREAVSLEIVLLGYPTVPTESNITVRGNYDAEELPRLLALEKADVIWFPAQVPETYSFTLTHAMASGLPIVSSNIGALQERLETYERHCLLNANSLPLEWLDALKTAASYQDAENRFFVDSRSDYRDWYQQPLSEKSAEPLADVIGLLDILQTFPAPMPQADKPIKSLLHYGIKTHHFGVLQEVARRMQVVPDSETEVAGMQQLRDAVSNLDDKTVALDQVQAEFSAYVSDAEDELRSLKYELGVVKVAADETIERYAKNLDAAQENIQELQEQGHNAQEYIDHLESELKLAREHVIQAISERDALLESFSWKVTRPIRVLKRFMIKAVHLLKVLTRHAFRPASYRRLFLLLKQGRIKDAVGILGYQTQGVLKQQNNLTDIAKETEQRVQYAQKVLEPVEQLSPLTLETSERPEVSIVIPVYGQHLTTYQCLKSISDNPPSLPYEVIVADDCSPEPAAQALDMVKGIRIVRGESNQGFVGNSNAGAFAARGQWVVLLNNDTIVTPAAFDRLIDTFSEHQNVGLVGAKLLNADGSLQEAGGIIWRDGSGWNWGRGERADDPRFNYVRDVDYCSGAVLAFKRDLFVELKGFDEYYKPAYYEDTDLAFRIRQRGLRVVYQPAAEVFHLEGVSHGTDETSGVKAYQVTNGKKFYERWKDVLASHNDNAIEPQSECHRATRGNVLVVEACMITPDQDSGSVRMLNLLQILKAEGYHVTFIADNLEFREKVVRQLNAMGVEVLYGAWAGSVRRVLRKLGPTLDAIFVSRHYIASQYIALARAVAPKAKFIFDTVDLHFVREEREAELSGDQALLQQSRDTKRKELGLIKDSDITLVVSEFEKTLLADIAPQARVEIVSNIHSHTPERPGYTEREGIIFVGGFRHPPNVDAVEWYVGEVLPHVKQMLPGVKTTIIGSQMPDSIKSLGSNESLRVLGFVEDIEPELMSARVSIAPLRYGAGVKGKVNEAMNYAIPVVATACAVEGMHAEDGVDCLISDDPKTFAKNIARVYNDAELWSKISLGGINNLESHFSPDAAKPAVRRILS